MGTMFTNLKGGALWAATAIVVAILGAATYLASQSILSGSDWLVVGSAVLTGTVGVTTAHVAGNAVGNALNTPPPIQPPPPPQEPVI